MRLAKERSREYKGKTYYKYLIFLPSKVRKKLGWEAGDELAADVEREHLVVRKKGGVRRERG
jgi:bifunctional DNA-binding transcriptional regulator/antitoxin component of YhaV-PrlF toxin-antitoxin module